MGSIGIAELIIIGLILVLLLGIVGVVVFVSRIKAMTTPIHVVPCRNCGRAIPQGAPACPQCGAPRMPPQ